MALLNIVVYPDKKLRMASVPVVDFPSIKQFCDDLVETMYRKDGVGLAAIQVGRPIQAFAVNSLYTTVTTNSQGEKVYQLLAPQLNDTGSPEAVVFVNPEITFLSAEKATLPEGCISFPGMFASITRSTRVEVKAKDPNGKVIHARAEDLSARVIQHEYDHLTGQLFIDLMGKVRREMALKKFNKDRR